MRLMKYVLPVILVSFMAAPADAQLLLCGDRAVLTNQLENEHSETQRGVGLTADGRLLEVFASPAGTWTLLLTRPDGHTCVIGHGEHWQVTPVKDSGPNY